MLSSMLGTSFIEFLKNEWLGLLASLIILVSFLMTDQIKIRIINMVGCIAFVIYGLLLPTYSTAFMNGALFIVHVVYLVKYFVKRRKDKTESKEPDSTEAPDTTEPAPPVVKEESTEQETNTDEKQ